MNLMNNCASPAVDVILKYNIRRCSMYTTRLKKVGGSIMLAVPRRAENAGAVDGQRSGYDH